MQCINCHEKIDGERMIHGFYLCTESHMQCRRCFDITDHQCPICGDMELSEYTFNIIPHTVDKTGTKLSVEMIRKPPDQTLVLDDNSKESISADICLLSEQFKVQEPLSKNAELTGETQVTHKNPNDSRAETVFITDDGKIFKKDLVIKASDLSRACGGYNVENHELGLSMRDPRSFGEFFYYPGTWQSNELGYRVRPDDKEKTIDNQEHFLDGQAIKYTTFTFNEPKIQDEVHIEEIHEVRAASPLSLNPFYEEIRIIEDSMINEQLPRPDPLSWERIEEFIKQEISHCIREFFSSEDFIKIFKKITSTKNLLEVNEEDNAKETCSKAVSTFSEPSLKLFQLHVPYNSPKYSHILAATHIPAPNNPVTLKKKPSYMDKQMMVLKAYRESSIPLDVDMPDIEQQGWGGHIPSAPEPDSESIITTNNERTETHIQKKKTLDDDMENYIKTVTRKIASKQLLEIVHGAKHTEKGDKIKSRVVRTETNKEKTPKCDFIEIPEVEKENIKKTDKIVYEVLCIPDKVIRDSSQSPRRRQKANKSQSKKEGELQRDTMKTKLQNNPTTLEFEMETNDLKDKKILGRRKMQGETNLLEEHKTKIVWESKKLPKTYRVLYNPKGIIHCPIHGMISCCCDFNELGCAPMSQPTISYANTKYYRFEAPQIVRMKDLYFSHEPIYCPDAFCRRSFLPTDCSKHYIIEHHNQPIVTIRIGQRLNFNLNPCPKQCNHAYSQLFIMISDRIREFGSTQYHNCMPLLVMSCKMKLTYLLGYQLRENSKLIDDDEDYLLIWILGVLTPELKSTYTFTTWRYNNEKPLCHISQTLNVLDIRERQIPINIYQNSDGLLLSPQELYLLTDSHKEFIQCQLEIHSND